MVAKTLSFSSYQPMFQPHAAAVVYKECLKNHAASLGGHALDGCGEFMPCSTDLTDPNSLKCAACGCHRNFHRQDTAEGHRELPHPPPVIPTSSVGFTPPHFSLLPRRFASSPSTSPSPSPPPPRHLNPPPPPPPPPPAAATSLQRYSPGPHMLMALSTGTGASPAPPDHLNHHQNRTKTEPSPVPSHHHQTRRNQNPNPNLSNNNNNNNSTAKRKRFRSKFSSEQKEKMRRFAEGLNWKMQRNNDKVVSEFCADVGVSKGVLKVWMHNNKNTVGKIPRKFNNISNHSSNNNGEEEEEEDHELEEQEDDQINSGNELGLTDHHHHHHHHHLGNNGSSCLA